MEETTPIQPVENDQLQETQTTDENAQVQPEAVAEQTTQETENGELKTENGELRTENEKPKAEETTAGTEEPAAEMPEANEEQKAEEPVESYEGLDREALTEKLRALMTEEVQQIRHRAGAIRNRFNELNRQAQKEAFEAFLAEGGNKDDYQAENDSIAEVFYNLYDQYRKRRQQYLEELEARKKKNLEEKKALIEELRALIDSDEEQVRGALDKFNAIQDRWKAIGEVPREEMNNLWQSYHFQIEQFFSKLKINRELRALDQKHNLEHKLQLCEKAEELIVEPSVTKAFKELQDLRAAWKETGPVPAEQNEEIWQRFQNAAAKIDERRREYNEQRKEEMESNLLAKQALLDKAQELTATAPQSTRQWNDTTTALDELLKVWKTIGPVPREVNEEIWSKFKGIIDRHYADKKEYFAAIRDEQDVNYQKKVELCLKAEAIAQRDDWKKATEELLALQKEWKEIGAVSRKVSDKVWQRFRGACDEFFARKGEFFKERRSSESENLAKKEAIIAALKEHTFGDNREENLAAIKDFQRQWAEVGYVPMADKERLYKEYRAVIDGIFENLKISAREAEETAYRERLKNVAGDTKRFVSNERQELQEKIEKLRSDLSLWENNLGFLASSKQADLLKQEFEKKMQSARQQIALMQAKLRILKESENAENEQPKNEE